LNPDVPTDRALFFARVIAVRPRLNASGVTENDTAGQLRAAIASTSTRRPSGQIASDCRAHREGFAEPPTEHCVERADIGEVAQVHSGLHDVVEPKPRRGKNRLELIEHGVTLRVDPVDRCAGGGLSAGEAARHHERTDIDEMAVGAGRRGQCGDVSSTAHEFS
jgi:hypothetical protein